MKIYASIQGESTHAGVPCVFVRLTGCHLRCVYCDTEHAFHEGQSLSRAAIHKQIEAHGIRTVELTVVNPCYKKMFFR